jgi:hypothetical protein
MPIFQVKSRSWESYVAGIGASGALMAGAIVMFVILVGVVTFKTWPQAGGLLGGSGGDVTLSEPARAVPAPARSSSPNLVKLLGGRATAAPARGGDVRRAGSVGIGDGLVPEPGRESPGRSGGSNAGQPQGAQPPPAPTQPRNAVSEAISGVGNTVQSDTDSLGQTVNTSTGTSLGDVVSGVGRTLNQNLQSLAGN